METKASYITVGIFITILFVGTLIFAMWLKGSSDTGRLPYRVFFNDSVKGLNVGAAVLYRGLPVGKISNISLDKTQYDRIQIDILVEKDLPIRQDALAILEMKSLTGGMVIQITGGTPSSPVLEHLKGSAPPIIESRSSSMEEILSKAPELVHHINTVAENLTHLFGEKNQESITNTLKNIEKVTNVFAKKTKTIDSIINEAKGLLQNGRVFLNKFNHEVKTTGEEFRKTLKFVGSFSDQAAKLIKENRQPIQDFSNAGLYEFTQLLMEMREMASNFTRLIRKLENNNLLFGQASKGVEIQ
jgi:phospholipid/cholesterol/gamma-HCH transport system substrate-binding protein